ncbi:hypothetical protein CRM22_003104 [Opisthorchis felineus]|uniref:Uncharacterized protein n=1 Tax=Opisthorchis felineus TaxID=147828 RepID=A0A4S2KR01_OPIFE|nr:hypothetical protein CRM22_010652 [Opisthorchis felineus]TGZ70610.1 hypothetical protein CRM22_003104 [Opisthorchis felineus]
MMELITKLILRTVDGINVERKPSVIEMIVSIISVIRRRLELCPDATLLAFPCYPTPPTFKVPFHRFYADKLGVVVFAIAQFPISPSKKRVTMMTQIGICIRMYFP